MEAFSQLHTQSSSWRPSMVFITTNPHSNNKTDKGSSGDGHVLTVISRE